MHAMHAARNKGGALPFFLMQDCTARLRRTALHSTALRRSALP